MTVNAADYTGTLVVDVTALKGKLFDLPPGERQGMRSEHEGMSAVTAELSSSAPSVAAVKDLHQQFVDQSQTIAELRAARAIVDKLAEVLDESEAKYVHERENTLSMIVDVVKSTAKRSGDPSILALFEETKGYISQSARKAAETRKKKAAAKKTAGGNG